MESGDTRGEDYATRLEQLSGARWKQVFDVQRPYRWNLRRLELGRTLDVGCGIGRNLLNLPPDSLGVDHNRRSVEIARSRGLNAVATDEFESQRPAEGTFDSLLFAHVLEHMTPDEARALVRAYLPYTRDKVVAICPQERGYASDATHVTFLDADDLSGILEDVGLRVAKAYSFPLPRFCGRVFTYNETVVLAHRR
jgi:SAM-dependent methyltransferase